jgi:hypothetical protein
MIASPPQAYHGINKPQVGFGALLSLEAFSKDDVGLLT